MPSSINVNLRVTGHCSQGARKYMEDMFSVAYQQTEDERDLEYAFFGIFDGHGGQQAATFAKEHLLDNIVNQKSFWSDRDTEVLRAIREGFLQTHLAMWRQLEHWPRTAVGFPSTSGTTASIAFIRRGKIYIGHVGDSSIVLGYQEGNGPWKGIPLTRDHKPESKEETLRIKQSGGKVVKKSGVPRVVWNRPRLGHRGPVRRSTPIDEIPFLAVARSLGDLWSYNPVLDVFVVSPEPDVMVHTIDVRQHRCLIFGTDGLWNVMTPSAAVEVIQAAEARNEQHMLQQGNGASDGDIPHLLKEFVLNLMIASPSTPSTPSREITEGASLHVTPAHVMDTKKCMIKLVHKCCEVWVNPSKSLVDRALEEWRCLQLHADNTSVVTLMLDPPGPPRLQVLQSQRQRQLEAMGRSAAMLPSSSESADVCSGRDLLASLPGSPLEAAGAGGVSIYTRICEPEAEAEEMDAEAEPETGAEPEGEAETEPEPVPDSSCNRAPPTPLLAPPLRASPPRLSPPRASPATPPAPVCLQSNEVSSSSTSKERPSLGREKSSVPNSDSPPVANNQGFKRRHSSGIPPSSLVANEKRKRTRSEHDCPSSKEWQRDEDAAASDAENDRVTWPPWGSDWTGPEAKPSPNGRKLSPRTIKSMLPLLPASLPNKNSGCVDRIASESALTSSKRTLRSRNVAPEGRTPEAAPREMLAGEPLAPEHREGGGGGGPRRWSRLASPPVPMCTRSRGRLSHPK